MFQATQAQALQSLVRALDRGASRRAARWLHALRLPPRVDTHSLLELLLMAPLGRRLAHTGMQALLHPLRVAPMGSGPVPQAVVRRLAFVIW